MSATEKEAVTNSNNVSEESVEKWCIDYIADVMNMPSEEVDPDARFDNFGLDSSVATAMIMELEEWLGIDIPPSVVFEQVTISNLVSDLMARVSATGQ